MPQKHWASADNIFAASEHMAHFLLCENHHKPSVYLPWLPLFPKLIANIPRQTWCVRGAWKWATRKQSWASW